MRVFLKLALLFCFQAAAEGEGALSSSCTANRIWGDETSMVQMTRSLTLGTATKAKPADVLSSGEKMSAHRGVSGERGSNDLASKLGPTEQEKEVAAASPAEEIAEDAMSSSLQGEDEEDEDFLRNGRFDRDGMLSAQPGTSPCPGPAKAMYGLSARGTNQRRLQMACYTKDDSIGNSVMLDVPANLTGQGKKRLYLDKARNSCPCPEMPTECQCKNLLGAALRHVNPIEPGEFSSDSLAQPMFSINPPDGLTNKIKKAKLEYDAKMLHEQHKWTRKLNKWNLKNGLAATYNPIPSPRPPPVRDLVLKTVFNITTFQNPAAGCSCYLQAARENGFLYLYTPVSAAHHGKCPTEIWDLNQPQEIGELSGICTKLMKLQCFGGWALTTKLYGSYVAAVE